MQITIITAPAVTVNPSKNGGRAWKKMEVLFRTLDGKVNTKTLVSFKNPTVFQQFELSKVGDVFEVESVLGEPDATGKIGDGRRFWEWKSAHVLLATDLSQVATDLSQVQPPVPQPETTTTVSKPVVKMIVTEADRNRYIIRQSSLERAIETLSAVGTLEEGPFGKEAVTKLAAYYEAWVLRPVVEQIGTVTLVAATPQATAAVQACADAGGRGRGRPRKVVPTVIDPTDDVPSEVS